MMMIKIYDSLWYTVYNLYHVYHIVDQTHNLHRMFSGVILLEAPRAATVEAVEESHSDTTLENSWDILRFPMISIYRNW